MSQETYPGVFQQRSAWTRNLGGSLYLSGPVQAAKRFRRSVMFHVPTAGAVDTGPVSPPRRHTHPTSRPRPRISNMRPQRSDQWLAQLVDVLTQAGALTPAEREVLEPLLLGRRYTEIATILGKSPHTVGVQVKNILRRLGASNSRDLLRVFLCELDQCGDLAPAAP